MQVRRLIEISKSGEKSFIGGTALTGATANINPSDSTGSLSMRNVAMAGKTKESPTSVPRQDGNMLGVGDGAGDVSDVSSLSGEEEFQEARDGFDDELEVPQPQFTVENSKAHSPARDSRFIEEI